MGEISWPPSRDATSDAWNDAEVSVSDRARNYVKDLSLPWPQKALLFLLADYHNVKAGCAWPGLDTLAEITGKDPRNVRRLIRQLEVSGKFKYVPGIGRGNYGRFYFLDLEKEVNENPFCKELKGVTKAVTKGVISSSVIRNNQEPLTKTSPNPAFQAGNSNFKLRHRDHTRIARWIDKASAPLPDGLAGRLDGLSWTSTVQYACAELMIPFEDAKHDLLLMDSEVWSARLDLKKEPERVSA
jgi:hypothetical protein